MITKYWHTKNLRHMTTGTNAFKCDVLMVTHCRGGNWCNIYTPAEETAHYIDHWAAQWSSLVDTTAHQATQYTATGQSCPLHCPV